MCVILNELIPIWTFINGKVGGEKNRLAVIIFVSFVPLRLRKHQCAANNDCGSNPTSAFEMLLLMIQVLCNENVSSYWQLGQDHYAAQQ